MQVSQIEQAAEETVEAVPSSERSSYMADNGLSLRDVASLAEMLGEGNIGIAEKLNHLQKQHLFMTLTDNKLERRKVVPNLWTK